MELVDLINTILCNYKPVLAVPSGSDSVRFLSSFKRYIKIPAFPVPSPDSFKILNDKWEFSQLLKKLGLPQPDTFLVQEPSSFKTSGLPLSLVSKQPCGENGKDMYFLTSKDSLLNFLKSCDRKLFPMIMQEYIPGYDVDLSILSIDGKIMTWSIQKGLRAGMIQFINEPEILELGQRLLQEIKYTGVAHFDLRYDERDRSFKFIECNPRFWATLKASCYCGVNFPHVGLQYAMRMLPDVPLIKYSPEGKVCMTYYALVRSFESLEAFHMITAHALRYCLKEICKLWFLNLMLNKYSPKASRVFVSIYDKVVKKIDYNKKAVCKGIPSAK